MRVASRQPELWVGYLQWLEERRDTIADQVAAERLFNQARRAIETEPCDFESLQSAVRQLIGLLPPDEQEEAAERCGFGSTLIAN